MISSLVNLTVEVELQQGEQLKLPETVIASVGAGRWRITIEPADEAPSGRTRDHTAFLNSYAPEDEGLYDDYPSR
jgi:hypothetical protein